ncbi:MAG: YdcF family protein [Pseudomonadota bacterium]
MRQILALFVILIGVWAVGLVGFIKALPSAASQPPADAEAVVVFTGAGGERLSTAMTLVDRNSGLRLMISGVNPAISRAEIAALWPGEAQAFDCCVDLGKSARTTTENARETRDWAQEHDFERLVLVTSDYHMPRALLETRGAMPGAEITPFPVASVFVGNDGRPTSLRAWRLVATEYTKYLAVRAKMLIS